MWAFFISDAESRVVTVDDHFYANRPVSDSSDVSGCKISKISFAFICFLYQIKCLVWNSSNLTAVCNVLWATFLSVLGCLLFPCAFWVLAVYFVVNLPMLVWCLCNNKVSVMIWFTCHLLWMISQGAARGGNTHECRQWFCLPVFTCDKHRQSVQCWWAEPIVWTGNEQ